MGAGDAGVGEHRLRLLRGVAQAYLDAEVAHQQELRAKHRESAVLQGADELGVVVPEHTGNGQWRQLGEPGVEKTLPDRGGVGLAHQRQDAGTSRPGRPDRSPADDAGALGDDMPDLVTADPSDAPLRERRLPRLCRWRLEPRDVARGHPPVEQVDGGGVLAAGGTHLDRLCIAHRDLFGSLVEEDLLGCELREAVLEEHADQRVVERQPHVVAMHALFEAAVAEVGEQALACEVTGGARGHAEVDDLPDGGAGARPLCLDEAHQALGVVLRDEQHVRRVAERNQRGQRLAEHMPEAQERGLRYGAVGLASQTALVGGEGVAVELFHPGQVAEGRGANVHAALTARAPATCSRNSRWMRSSPVISGWKVRPRCAPCRTATGSPSRRASTSTPSPVRSMRGARMNTPRNGMSPSAGSVRSASDDCTWLPQPLRRTVMSNAARASWSGRPSTMAALSRMSPAHVVSVGRPASRRARSGASSAKACSSLLMVVDSPPGMARASTASSS